jgi:predicted methyltransferase
MTDDTSEHQRAKGKSVVSYRSIGELAAALDSLRPEPDPQLEQFLMMAPNLADQAEYLGRIFADRRVLFLGDDDHVSILVAAFSTVSPVVYEVDHRVVASLKSWADRLPLPSYSVALHDIREPFRQPPECDAFYINPPYSSKTDGYGIKFWISRALEGCVPYCEGVIVLPADSDGGWIDQNWLSVQDFLTANGFRIVNPHNDVRHMYHGTNDLGLRSENLRVRRVDPSRRLPIEPRPGTHLYR